MARVTRVPVLVTTIAGQTCVVPIDQVVETLRPPANIEGTCVHRGDVVPMIRAAALRGHDAPPRRCVVIRVGTDRVAVLVDDVVEVVSHDAADLARFTGAFTSDHLRDLPAPIAAALASIRRPPGTA